MTPTSSPTSTETLPDLTIVGRAKLPLVMAGVIALVGLTQLVSPFLTLAAFFGGGFQDGMAVDALIGAGGAVLSFFLSWAVLSVPRPVLVFRADRLEVGRMFGKFSSVSYRELMTEAAQAGIATSKAPVRLRELSIPGWVMTAAENEAWQAELARRVPGMVG